MSQRARGCEACQGGLGPLSVVGGRCPVCGTGIWRPPQADPTRRPATRDADPEAPPSPLHPAQRIDRAEVALVRANLRDRAAAQRAHQAAGVVMAISTATMASAVLILLAWPTAPASSSAGPRRDRSGDDVTDRDPTNDAAEPSGPPPEVVPPPSAPLGPEAIATARTAIDRGRFEEALALLDRLVEASPDSALVRVYRARAHLGAGDDEAAAADLDRAFEGGTGSVEAHVFRAIARARRREVALALEDTATATRLAPTSATFERACHPTGCALRLRGFGDAARRLGALVESGAERDGGRTLEALVACTLALARSTPHDAALADLEVRVSRLLDARSDVAARHVDAFFELAARYRVEDRTDDELASLRAGLRIAPRARPEAQLRLAELEVAAGRAAIAAERLRLLTRSTERIRWRTPPTPEQIAEARERLRLIPTEVLRQRAWRRPEVRGVALLVVIFGDASRDEIAAILPRAEHALGVDLVLADDQPWPSPQRATRLTDEFGVEQLTHARGALRRQLRDLAAARDDGSTLDGVLGLTGVELKTEEDDPKSSVRAPRVLRIASRVQPQRRRGPVRQELVGSRRAVLADLSRAAGEALGVPSCTFPSCPRSQAADVAREASGIWLCIECVVAIEALQ